MIAIKYHGSNTQQQNDDESRNPRIKAKRKKDSGLVISNTFVVCRLSSEKRAQREKMMNDSDNIPHRASLKATESSELG